MKKLLLSLLFTPFILFVQNLTTLKILLQSYGMLARHHNNGIAPISLETYTDAVTTEV